MAFQPPKREFLLVRADRVVRRELAHHRKFPHSADVVL
jgi:hypothetical protein